MTDHTDLPEFNPDCPEWCYGCSEKCPIKDAPITAKETSVEVTANTEMMK